ncbi:GntR family transcriptional regulator [Jiangella alba]|uniref:DNA-binding transcriptional regulator, GntR family n=1 Tax=Jiangella alba TaxID=561176 RepID=A0A1H5PZX1_9ACTN|nr:GntR family transcriptional regulator [Jiangella alba]SEF18738.1 DNA-binding transcriptional regulator, GntR family [Jiangella alba]
MANDQFADDARESVTEFVTRSLRQRIIDGALEPGRPLRQEALARELGVSRLPIREALRQLESEGLVAFRPRSGAKVAVLDFEEYNEIYKVRERLEPLAISESMAHLTVEQREAIEVAAAEVEAHAGDPASWLEADRRFHLACYAGVPTPRLLQMIVEFWNSTHRYRRILLTTFAPKDFEVAHSEHRLIANAISEGNARAAEELIRVHIERSRRRLNRHRDLFDQ